MRLELLETMLALADDAPVRDAFHRQLREEAEHVRIYRSLLDDGLPPALRDRFAPAIDLRAGRFLRRSLEALVVRSFVVLESVAMGMFTVRCRLCRGAPAAEVGRAIAQEEAKLQRFAAGLVVPVSQRKRMIAPHSANGVFGGWGTEKTEGREPCALHRDE